MPGETPDEGTRINALYVPHPDLLADIGVEATEATGVRDAEYGFLLESICGTTDDSQPVEQYDGTLGVTTAFVDTHETAVAQVQWNSNLAAAYDDPGNVSGVRWGSGTMITADLFLTCGHLFDQTGGGWSRPKVDGTTNVISPQEIATNMHLNFGYQHDEDGTIQPGQSYAITELVEYRLGGVDMAICRVAGNPGSIHGTTAVSTTDANTDEMLCIIGHPAGMPKRIEAGPTTDVTSTQLRYDDIDTLGGNSGSGVLSGVTGRIVGVHTNGGCNSAGFNYGVPIEAFRAVSPTLQGLGSIPTLAALDTSVVADTIATLVGADTSPRADQILTRPWADDIATLVQVDSPATIHFLDTSPIADIIGTHVAVDSPGTRPGLDVATSPAGDVGPTLQEHIVRDPGAIVGDPTIGQPGGLRPFVLATPHHAETPITGAAAAGVDRRTQFESLLAEYEQGMEVQRTVLEELEAAYTQVHEQYVQEFGHQA